MGYTKIFAAVSFGLLFTYIGICLRVLPRFLFLKSSCIDAKV